MRAPRLPRRGLSWRRRARSWQVAEWLSFDVAHGVVSQILPGGAVSASAIREMRQLDPRASNDRAFGTLTASLTWACAGEPAGCLASVSPTLFQRCLVIREGGRVAAANRRCAGHRMPSRVSIPLRPNLPAYQRAPLAGIPPGGYFCPPGVCVCGYLGARHKSSTGFMVDIDETQLDSPPSRWLWPSGSG